MPRDYKLTDAPRAYSSWMDDGVVDLTNRLAEAAKYLSLDECAEKTSLSTVTLLDLLRRKRIDDETVPKSALSRPAARMGKNPLYSKAQVKTYLGRLKARDAQSTRASAVPTLTPEEAAEQGAMTLQQLADHHGMSKIHLRRSMSESDSCPGPVGKLLAATKGQRPLLFDERAVSAWLAERKTGQS